MDSIHNLISEIQAIAQIGIQYTKDPYDEERYHRLRQISFEMMAHLSDLPLSSFEKFFLPDSGYATPKVDLRACVFQDNKILLVKERSDGKWTLPGGWADQNEAPQAGVIREVLEESGYQIETTKLYAIKDRSSHPYINQHPFTTFKLFFLGKVVGGEPLENLEISEIGFFDLGDLPLLSTDRVLADDLHLGWHHYQNPLDPPYVD